MPDTRDLTYSISDVSVTYFSQVDKYFRLKHRVHSRIDALKQQAKLIRTYYKLDHFLEESSMVKEGHLVYGSIPFNLDFSLFDQHITALDNLYIRLDNNTIICNEDNYKQDYSEYMTYPKTIEEHSKLLFGGKYYKKRSVNRNNPIISHFFDNFKKVSINSRRRDSLALLRLECKQRVKEGWFLVFNTLTVTDSYLKEVFDVGSTVWTDYVRSVDRACGLSIYPSWNDALEARKAGHEFHTYYAVVERGSKTGRLHIHCLHFMRSLPKGCYDPNAGLNKPYNREIEYFRKFWKYGSCTPIAVRFNSSDAYAKAFWRWPVEKGTYKPLECKDCEALVTYMGKYITKDIQEPVSKEEPIRWRIRKSRNLGMMFLNHLVNQMSENQLILILQVMSPTLSIRNRPLPAIPLKILSLRKLRTNYWKKNMTHIQNKIQGLKSRENILKQLVNLIQNRTISKTLKTGDLKVRHYLAMEGFNFRSLLECTFDNYFGNMSLSYQTGCYTGAHI